MQDTVNDINQIGKVVTYYLDKHDILKSITKPSPGAFGKNISNFVYASDKVNVDVIWLKDEYVIVDIFVWNYDTSLWVLREYIIITKTMLSDIDNCVATYATIISNQIQSALEKGLRK